MQLATKPVTIKNNLKQQLCGKKEKDAQLVSLLLFIILANNKNLIKILLSLEII